MYQHYMKGHYKLNGALLKHTPEYFKSLHNSN